MNENTSVKFLKKIIMLSFIVIIIFVFLLAILAIYNKSLLNKNEITLLRESAKAYYN
jgi:hypothetical protein